MRKTLRIFLWMIKGLLLLIALAALVAWPVSRGREFAMDCQRAGMLYDPPVEEHRWVVLWAKCWDGYLVLG